jgi:hypothetical protein
MRFRQKVSLRCGCFFVCMLVGLALGSCHPEGHKDLLAFLQDGSTTNNDVETRLGPASIWGEGSIWTYRIGKASDEFYLFPKKSDWLEDRYWWDARFSLVLEFDPNGVLRRHALINVETRPSGGFRHSLWSLPCCLPLAYPSGRIT